MTTTISSIAIRQHLGELMEQAHYQNKQFRIMRKDKPMAWLVGEVFMQNVNTAMEYIIEHNPALADSLAITMDHEIASVIEKGNQEVKKGNFLPIESILTDE